jgi:malonate transporter and related proteins
VATLISIILPIFAVIGFGLASARLRIISEEGFRALNAYVFWLATPALLFGAGAEATTRGGPVALVFFAVALPLFIGAALIARRGLGQGLTLASGFGLNAVFGNSVMMGLPVVSAAYGQAGLALLLGIIALHSLLLLPAATALAELGQAGRASLPLLLARLAGAILRNPVVAAVLAAWAFSLTGLALPEAVRRLCALLGGSAPPVALFCLGGSLAGFAIGRAMLGEVALASVLKLVVMPGLVWLLARGAGLGPLETAVVVTVAALPTGANAFLLARRYASGAERSGATVLVSTAASVVTLGWLLAVLAPG